MQSSAETCQRYGWRLLLVILIAPAQYALPQDDDEGQSLGVLEEVTVTARRYEENIADVPVSVNVMSGDYLEAAGLSNVRAIPNTPVPPRSTVLRLTPFLGSLT